MSVGRCADEHNKVDTCSGVFLSYEQTQSTEAPGTQMDLKSVLSKSSQAHKDKYCIVPLKQSI